MIIVVVIEILRRFFVLIMRKNFVGVMLAVAIDKSEEKAQN